eukprot:XP_001695203.1 G protein beta WD-40 [Chlamydomonas reinhardtii]
MGWRTCWRRRRRGRRRARRRVGLFSGVHQDCVYCLQLRPQRQHQQRQQQQQQQQPALQAAGPPSPPPLVVATGSADGVVALWDGDTRVRLAELIPGLPPQPEGDVGEGGEQEAEAQTVTFGFDLSEQRATTSAAAAAAGHKSSSGAVQVLAFSPDGAWMAVATGAGPVAVWDVAAGLMRERLRGHHDAVTCMAAAPAPAAGAGAAGAGTGPHFATGATRGDCSVRLWRHTPSADPAGWAAALRAARRQAEEDASAAAAAAAERKAARAAERAAAREQALANGGDGDGAAPAAEGGEEDVEDSEEEEQEVQLLRCRRPCQWQCVSVLRGHTAHVTSVVFLPPASPVPVVAVPGGAGLAEAFRGMRVASGSGEYPGWRRVMG